MKCLLWFKEKKNKEPKLYLIVKGEKSKMCVVMEKIHDALLGIKS